MNTILTIIVPAYNMEKYLDRCLSSLVVDKGLMNLFDVLVINDGSKDRTSEIGHGYEAKYPGTFRVIDKENGHYGSCVNRGLAEAKGTFVKILDADDLFDYSVFPEFLHFLKQPAVYNCADLVLSNYVESDTDLVFIREHKYDKHSPNPFSLGDLSLNDRNEWFIHGLTYRTSILLDNSYRQSEGLAYTDHEWAFFPLPYIKSIYQFEKTLYLYLIGRDDQSVAAATHAKHLDAEVSVVYSLLRNYTSMPKVKNKADQLFIQETLYANVEHLYRLYLIDIPRNFIPTYKPLIEFDSRLKECFPDLYQRTDGFQITTARIHFKTISNWRNGRKFNLWAQRTLYKLADNWNLIFKRRYA